MRGDILGVMPTPRSFPQTNGKPCGSEWWRELTVTGHIPGTGYGGQFTKTIKPIVPTVERRSVLNAGVSREAQLDFKSDIYDRIEKIRGKLQMGPQFGVEQLTAGETEQIEWLLDRSEEALSVADELWFKWVHRGLGTHQSKHGTVRSAWPLDQTPDTFAGFSAYCRPDDYGNWIWENKYGEFPRSKTDVLCPTHIEVFMRGKDRKLIGTMISEALQHVYCAEWGYWRIRLFKRAGDRYRKRPDSEIGGFTTDPGTGGGGGGSRFEGPNTLSGKVRDIDPCRDMGIGCPKGEEPEGCLSGFCPDGNELEDPPPFPGIDDDSTSPLGGSSGDLAPTDEEIDEGVPTIAVVAAGAGVLAIGGTLMYALGSRR